MCDIGDDDEAILCEGPDDLLSSQRPLFLNGQLWADDGASTKRVRRSG
ncbi:MAG: hypothetical protein KDD73_06795 [Anaerolineales bacterium]|nr:hypothetical protein [Anaerolineales bacterium]MCB9128114.1 hypothetical protein [Ardenticatenales bacterium]